MQEIEYRKYLDKLVSTWQLKPRPAGDYLSRIKRLVKSASRINQLFSLDR